MSDNPELLPPPVWIGPILDRLDDLAARREITCFSRDACDCLMHFLGLEDIPSPIVESIADGQATLAWRGKHYTIEVKPYWLWDRVFCCQLTVYVGSKFLFRQRKAESLDPLRYWLAEAYEDIGARLDVGESEDDVNRLMVAMILEVGRKTTFGGDEYYVVGGYVYRVLGEAAYEEVGEHS